MCSQCSHMHSFPPGLSPLGPHTTSHDGWRRHRPCTGVGRRAILPPLARQMNLLLNKCCFCDIHSVCFLSLLFGRDGCVWKSQQTPRSFFPAEGVPTCEGSRVDWIATFARGFLVGVNVVVGFVQQGLLLSSKDHRNDGFGRPARGSVAQNCWSGTKPWIIPC